MTEIRMESGQVATASGLIYICHPKYGISEIKNITLEPYLAILQLQPIDSASVTVHGLRRLDFSEFERMGFEIKFRLDSSGHDDDDKETVQLHQPLQWFEDEEEDESDGSFSDPQETSTLHRPKKTFIRQNLSPRKRIHYPDLSSTSPVPEKKSKRTTKYPCTGCHLEFTNAKHLRTHAFAYKHGLDERPFKCDKCGKTFKWKSDCLQHNRLYHRPEQTTEPTGWTTQITTETTMKLPLLQIGAIRTFDEASNILALEVDNLASKACGEVPQLCPGPSATYLVDMTKLNHPHDIIRDSYGCWGQCSSKTGFYTMDEESKTLKKLNSRGTKKQLPENAKIDFKVVRKDYWHPQAKEFKKIIFIGYFDRDLSVPTWAIVSYEWSCTPYDFKNKPHGNAKYHKDKPYQPTAKSVLLAMSERAANLTPKQNFAMISEQVEKAAGPAFVPVNYKQARNMRYRGRKKST